MSYYSYISLMQDLSKDLERAGILNIDVYHSLFKEIRRIIKNIQQDKDFIRSKDISVSEKYNRVQYYNALLVDYLTKLISGLNSGPDEPGSLLAPIGKIILSMNSIMPKYIDSENTFSMNYLLGVANGTSKAYVLMSQMAFFITDLIDQVFYSNGYISILLNEALIALSELQGMNNEVMMQVFEELQSTKDQLNKMSEDLKYIKERLGLSQ